MGYQPAEQTRAVRLSSARNKETARQLAETLEGESIGHAEVKPDLSAWDLSLLFERYSRLVLGTAYRILGNANEAEEVVQEVFLYLHRKFQLFDPSKSSIKSWIFKIAFTRALDRKSYLARRTFYFTPEIASLKGCEQIDLEQQIQASLNRQRLERALADLTHMQRRTIEFFYFEGLDLREISQQLNQPLGNVRHHLYRGLERLRKSAVLHKPECK